MQKLYIQHNQIPKIGRQLLNIVEQAFSHYQHQPSKTMMKRVISYAVEEYCYSATRQFCTGFIDYLDIKQFQARIQHEPMNLRPNQDLQADRRANSFLGQGLVQLNPKVDVAINTNTSIDRNHIMNMDKNTDHYKNNKIKFIDLNEGKQSIKLR